MKCKKLSEGIEIDELRAELAGAEAYIEELEEQIEKMGMGDAGAVKVATLPEPWDSVDELVEDLRQAMAERDQWRQEATEYGMRVKNLESASGELKTLIKEQMNLIDELRDRVEGTAGAAEYLEGSGKKSSLPVRAGLAAVRFVAQRFIRS